MSRKEVILFTPLFQDAAGEDGVYDGVPGVRGEQPRGVGGLLPARGL